MRGTRCALLRFSFLLWAICSVPLALTQQQPRRAPPLSTQEILQLQVKAQSGDPDAQLNLGSAYADGNGVLQNDQQALKWYRAAADQGNAAAQSSLGLFFRLGRGVEQDKVEAVKWYRKAARQEYATAMFNLGTAYYNGDGVAIDDVTAYAWFMLAQDRGNAPAEEAVKRMSENKGNLTEAAFERIGDMFLKGDDLPQSISDAANWYRKAAETGLPPLQMKLAGLLLQGPGADSNYPEVYRLCEKAAKRQFPAGIYCIGLLYQQGWGVARDLPQAAKRFDEAANMGVAGAMLRLGEMYWKGEGVKQDRIAAYEFVTLAAMSNLPDATLEKQSFEKQMSPKEMEKGKVKATQWANQHLSEPLVLRRKVPTTN